MASDVFAAQVALLVRVLARFDRTLPFALKGGTAINLFVQDLPRLSVDIDLAYTIGHEGRDEALLGIHDGLARLKADLEGLGLRVHPSPPGVRWTKLVVSDRQVQVKVEVSPVLRGTVHTPERRRVRPAVEDRFGFAEVPVLALPDLYAGKLVAALDRQHPRDLFDVHHFLRQSRLDRETVAAFLVYLVSHDRPLHEVLKPGLKDIEREYNAAFVGMTVEPVPLETLVTARSDLLGQLHGSFTEADRRFLVSVAQGTPDWTLLDLPGIETLPAVRWKLHNVSRMHPDKRTQAVTALRAVLWPETDPA